MTATEPIAGINAYLTRPSGIGVRADVHDVDPADSADALQIPSSGAENIWIVI
ncbi:MAG: hypothetical protein U9Q37_06945 [Euryarchaeota archaeon]|nr:hypothetical protein [Euryarchaeota archaeon]